MVCPCSRWTVPGKNPGRGPWAASSRSSQGWFNGQPGVIPIGSVRRVTGTIQENARIPADMLGNLVAETAT